VIVYIPAAMVGLVFLVRVLLPFSHYVCLHFLCYLVGRDFPFEAIQPTFHDVLMDDNYPLSANA